jgi:signal transduction histidine kinase
MSAGKHLGAIFLEEEDFVRFNQWIWITRLRCIAGLLILASLVKWVGPSSIRFTPVVLVCAADLGASLVYRKWLRARRALRLLAYVQLSVDVVALMCGLLFIGQSPLLFHFVFLLPVVPASMIESECGLAIATLATVGHVLLLWVRGGGDLLSVGGLLPPATFFLVAGQSRFYAQHLAQKNMELAQAAESLNESNQRLEEEAAISGALLRAAQALTTSLDPRDILERLNEVVRDALACQWSATLLHDTERSSYRVAAISGTEPDVIDEVRSFEFPSASIPLLAVAAQQGVVAVESPDTPLFPRDLMERWHFTSFLCADLQRAGASIGLLTAGYNGRTGPFSPREMRVFRSIAQQAAVALENARLVESLRAASRLKSEFIGTMSHELRSPLNVVIGYVDLLLDGDMGVLPPDQRQALERVRQHALQLLDLIQETLDINRLEAGLLPLDLETFTVYEFVNDVRDSIPTDWQKRDVALTWEVDATPVLIRTDRAKLKKVVRNLVHNALKFTDSGAVTVKAASENGWVDFVVSDTGIGIVPEALPIIFEMFRQADGSPTRRHGGVGLGLYIVKQLVRGIGGDISVTSNVGVGSTFRVRLRRGE